MGELTIVILCQALSNLTNNRCNLVENSNTCRCTGDVVGPISSTVVGNPSSDIMLSEVFLIFFVLGIWLSAIGFCLNQYKSLRRLETQVHFSVNRKDPLNIGDIKIVAREQDSIIYKKKRYSAVLDTQMNTEQLKSMHYVQQYLPKANLIRIPSTLSAIVDSRDDLTSNIPISTTMKFNSSNNIQSNIRPDLTEYLSLLPNSDMNRCSNIHRTGSARYSTGLTIPYISTSNSSHTSWNDSNTYETNSSTQHLCVPSNSLRSTRYSDGNISLPVPQLTGKNSEKSGEKLLDPRLIPQTVRRSLLALHRESQENLNMIKRKDQTQSENDVHGSFIPWKIKMKSKLKRAHQQQSRPYSNTFSILPIRQTSSDYERRVTENTPINNDSRSIRSSAPLVRRSLKHYPKYATQSTTESDSTQGELAIVTNLCTPSDDDRLSKSIIEKN